MSQREYTIIILHLLPNNFAIFYFVTVQFLFNESLVGWLFLHSFKLCTCTTTYSNCASPWQKICQWL